VIVSTTLAGPGAEASIGAALLSCANLVDEHLILVARSQLESMAAAVKAAGIPINRLRWRVYEWPGSYGEARNAALRFAEEEGATWALTIDSDERLEMPRLDLGDAEASVHVLLCPDSRLAYQKPRFIRCGVGARWIGPCCERLEASGLRGILPGQFHEAPKTPEQERRRYERGLEHMPAMIEQEPTQPQWRRHLAECLIGVGRHEEGIDNFREMLTYPELPASAEAWCHYRIAEWEIGLGELEQAFERCARALAEHPGFVQEFGYLLAHMNILRKRYAEGVTWAEYALNAPLDMTRGGHRSPTWREGCEHILASARNTQGQPVRRPTKPS
jgi:tetratricopeptide (TPR) repeat protein